jgi:hypothetical protein
MGVSVLAADGENSSAETELVTAGARATAWARQPGADPLHPPSNRALSRASCDRELCGGHMSFMGCRRIYQVVERWATEVATVALIAVGLAYVGASRGPQMRVWRAVSRF